MTLLSIVLSSVTTHWAPSHEEISFLPPSGCILEVFPFWKSLFQSRGVHVLHGVIVGAVLTRHYVMGRAELIFQTGRRKKTKGVTQVRKPWMSEWQFCPSAELYLLSMLPFSQPGNKTQEKHRVHNLVVVNQTYLWQRPTVRRCPLNKQNVGTVGSSKSCLRPQGHSCKRQCCCTFTASPSPSSMCCSRTAWLQWKLSPKRRKLHALYARQPWSLL